LQRSRCLTLSLVFRSLAPPRPHATRTHHTMAATAVQVAPGTPFPLPAPTATSASGLLALLSEPDPALSAAALRGLNACVPSFWFEIATSVALVEAKADDPGFEHRELAALVASKVWERERERGERRRKRAPLASNARHRNARDLALTAPAPLLFFQVFYHLGELDDALTYALAAGTLFDVNDAGDFTQAVLGERRRGETGGRSAGQTERPHPAAFVGGQAWPIAPPGRPGLDGLHLCAM